MTELEDKLEIIACELEKGHVASAIIELDEIILSIRASLKLQPEYKVGADRAIVAFEDLKFLASSFREIAIESVRNLAHAIKETKIEESKRGIN